MSIKKAEKKGLLSAKDSWTLVPFSSFYPKPHKRFYWGMLCLCCRNQIRGELKLFSAMIKYAYLHVKASGSNLSLPYYLAF